jgi:hypothetical protein
MVLMCITFEIGVPTFDHAAHAKRKPALINSQYFIILPTFWEMLKIPRAVQPGARYYETHAGVGFQHILTIKLFLAFSLN